MTQPAENANIARYLLMMAQERADQPAVITQKDDARLTFAELEALSNRYAGGLIDAGLLRGMRVLVMIRPGLDFAAVVFALFKIGALPVMIDPGMGVRKLLGCVRQVRPEALIGIPQAQVLRLLNPAAFSSVKCAVTVGRRWGWSGPTLTELGERTSDRFEMVTVGFDEPAAILFTSGSTGPAKGVVYEHGMFDAQVRSIQSHYDLRPGEVELATFALFALFCPALGMTCVFPEMNFSRPGRVDPRRIVQAVCYYQTTNAFGSPALWDRVSRYCVRMGIRLPWLRRVLMAGAPVNWRIVQRVKKCISPTAEVYTPYGATEALPVASIGGGENLGSCVDRTRQGAGICVGRAVPGRKVRVMRIAEEPIERWTADLEMSAGEKGEIVVSGEVVTKEYFEQPAATAAAKIREGEQLWHRMGDIGYFDEQGRLWYCGRKSHRVETANGTLFSECCEAIFNEHPDVARSALVGVGPKGRQRPVIIIEPIRRFAKLGRNGRMLKDELLALGRKNPLTASIDGVLFHDSFPVDVRHNAKINRARLAEWAAGRLA